MELLDYEEERGEAKREREKARGGDNRKRERERERERERKREEKEVGEVESALRGYLGTFWVHFGTVLRPLGASGGGPFRGPILTSIWGPIFDPQNDPQKGPGATLAPTPHFQKMARSYCKL